MAPPIKWPHRDRERARAKRRYHHPRYLQERVCEMCQTPFQVSKFSTARTCSPRCRADLIRWTRSLHEETYRATISRPLPTADSGSAIMPTTPPPPATPTPEPVTIPVILSRLLDHPYTEVVPLLAALNDVDLAILEALGRDLRLATQGERGRRARRHDPKARPTTGGHLRHTDPPGG